LRAQSVAAGGQSFAERAFSLARVVKQQSQELSYQEKVRDVLRRQNAGLQGENTALQHSNASLQKTVSVKVAQTVLQTIVSRAVQVSLLFCKPCLDFPL
jgi:hypothetical protein